jgi:hypothetical protein
MVQAVTSTSDGDLVVWGEQGQQAHMGTCPTDRAAAKIMRLHHAPITHLSVVGPYVVSGGGDGFVRFYDNMLRLVAWFEEFAAGPISCVSFSNEQQQAQAPRSAAVVNK